MALDLSKTRRRLHATLRSLEAAALLILASANASGALWVSPAGDDTNPGTEEKPLLTVDAARLLVRSLDRNMTDDITVFVAGGTYRLEGPLVFGPEDSGTNGYNIVYTASTPERPVLTGGIPVRGWTLSDPAKNIWAARLPSGVPLGACLYVNGRRTAVVQGRPPQALIPQPYGYLDPQKTLSSWRNPDQLEFVYPTRFDLWSERAGALTPIGMCRCEVASVVGEKIVMGQPGFSLLQAAALGKNTKPGEDTLIPSFVLNAYERLGVAGQAYFDVSGASVYYTPRVDEDMAKADTVVAKLETLLSVAGTPASPVSNLIFKGIQLEYARPGSGAVRISHATGLQFIEDGLAFVDGAGVALDGGNSALAFQGCRFDSISEAAITGGAAGLAIQNCRFAGIGLRGPSRTCLRLKPEGTTEISQNEFWPADASVIALDGRTPDTVVAHNVFRTELAVPSVPGEGIDPPLQDSFGAALYHSTTPDEPLGVAADAEDGSALVSWTDPTYDGGSPLLAYLVIPSAGTPVRVSVDDFKRQGYVLIDGLTNGNAVSFSVAAVNALGASPACVPSQTVTPGPKHRLKPPGPPVHVQVRVVGTKALIQFERPNSDGGSPVLGYAVTLNPGERILVEGRSVLQLAARQPASLNLAVPTVEKWTVSVAAFSLAGTGPDVTVRPSR